MARSIGLPGGAGLRRPRGGTEIRAALKRRLCEGLGIGLMLSALLLFAALASYNPQDPSLDTAIDAAARNLLGREGAVLSDLLRQSLGFAAFVIPLVLLGWSLRLLLDRPPRSLAHKFGLLLAAVILAAFALSVLDPHTGSGALRHGGALGWEWQRLLARTGLAAAALPVSMTAAAGFGLLILLIFGLSSSEWRRLGRGAGRVAILCGRGTMVAAGFGERLVRRWWQARFAATEGFELVRTFVEVETKYEQKMS